MYDSLLYITYGILYHSILLYFRRINAVQISVLQSQPCDVSPS